MKRIELYMMTVVACFCMLQGLSSCSNENYSELMENATAVTFNVGLSDEAVAYTRSAFMNKPDTVYGMLSNGKVLEVTVEDVTNKDVTSRSTTTTNMAANTMVRVYVVDNSTSKVVSQQDLKVSAANQLTIAIPKSGTYKVYFFSCNSTTDNTGAPSSTVGSLITSATSTISADYKYLWAMVSDVTASSTVVPTVNFSHICAEAMVTLTSGDGSTINGFNASLAGMASTSAVINPTINYTVSGAATLSWTPSASTSTYTPFISTGGQTTSSTATLTLSSVNFEGTTLTLTSNNTLSLQQIYLPGHKYNFKATVNPGQYVVTVLNELPTLGTLGVTLSGSHAVKTAITNGYKVTLNKKYANETFVLSVTGLKTNYTYGFVWNGMVNGSANNFKDIINWTNVGIKTDDGLTYKTCIYYNYSTYVTFPSTATTGTANTDCPSLQQIQNYLAAGVYWDDGSSMASPPYQINGVTYRIGLWLKKGAYTGTSTVQSTTPLPATDAIRTGGDYFFLPACMNGATGNYWASTSSTSMSGAEYVLFCNSSTAQIAQYGDNYKLGLWKPQ
jgi:hypothetical protein